MTLQPETFESAADELAVTLPIPTQSWLGRLTGRLSGSLAPKKKPQQRPSSPLPLPSEQRLKSSQSDSAYDASSTLPPTVLYLAYGSNLCYETFQSRRGIRPISAVNVVVPQLSLAFDLPGFPYIEPCFANSAHRKIDGLQIQEASVGADGEKQSLLLNVDSKDVPLVGVVYEVTRDDYKTILRTEGPAYADVVVECHALASSEAATPASTGPRTFKAHTLLAPTHKLRPIQSSGPAQPSLRYLTLCRNGAAEHNLPLQWQNHLNALQHYHTTSIRQVVGKSIFVIFWGPIILLSFGLRRVLEGKNGTSSAVARGFTQSVLRSMWVSYDYFFKHVFGDGERTELR